MNLISSVIAAGAVAVIAGSFHKVGLPAANYMEYILPLDSLRG